MERSESGVEKDGIVDTIDKDSSVPIVIIFVIKNT